MTLPTGTVTFLFTDIEASTRLLTRDPERYPAVVAKQRTVIVGDVDDVGGFEHRAGRGWRRPAGSGRR